MSQKIVKLSECYSTDAKIKNTFNKSNDSTDAIKIIKDAIDEKADQNDSRFDDHTPSAHTHGNLQNNGQVGTSMQANKNVVTNGEGKIATEDKLSLGTTHSTAAYGDHIHSNYLTQHQSLDNCIKISGNNKNILLADGTTITDVNVDNNKYWTHPKAASAHTGKPTESSPITPAFGDTFSITQITNNNTGHITSTSDKNIKIPNNLGDGSTAGLSTNDFTNNYKNNLTNLTSSSSEIKNAHKHNIADINNLNDTLSNKSNTGHAHSVDDIDDFPSTMPPSAHEHTKSDITDWSNWKLVGRYPTNRDVDDNGGWQRIYSNDLLVYAFVHTWPVPVNNSTWSRAGTLQVDSEFYAPPTKLFCPYVKNSLIMLRGNKEINVTCYGTEQTMTTNFYATFLYPCGLNILNLPIGE